MRWVRPYNLEVSIDLSDRGAWPGNEGEGLLGLVGLSDEGRQGH